MSKIILVFLLISFGVYSRMTNLQLNTALLSPKAKSAGFQIFILENNNGEGKHPILKPHQKAGKTQFNQIERLSYLFRKNKGKNQALRSYQYQALNKIRQNKIKQNKGGFQLENFQSKVKDYIFKEKFGGNSRLNEFDNSFNKAWEVQPKQTEKDHTNVVHSNPKHKSSHSQVNQSAHEHHSSFQFQDNLVKGIGSSGESSEGRNHLSEHILPDKTEDSTTIWSISHIEKPRYYFYPCKIDSDCMAALPKSIRIRITPICNTATLKCEFE